MKKGLVVIKYFSGLLFTDAKLISFWVIFGKSSELCQV